MIVYLIISTIEGSVAFVCSTGKTKVKILNVIII